MAQKLWYLQPASCWREALAVGNGRLGAMVFGGVEREQLQLNEDTLWAGRPHDPVNPRSAEGIAQARELIAAGRYVEADKVVDEKVMATPLKQMPYQCVGDLLLTFPCADDVSDYRRELDLDDAIARTRYSAVGVRYQREVFASAVDQVVVVRLEADRPGAISFAASFASPQQATSKTEANDTLVLRGTNGACERIEGGLTFEARLRVIPVGGRVTAHGESLSVEGADSAVLLLAMATSYRRFDDISGDPTALTRQAIDAASRRPFAALRQDHIAEHRRLFHRVQLDLGTTSAAELPTDRRIADSAKLDDPALATLFFQFARYLMISASRPGTQPMNLQGIWNDLLSPPWGCKYTININTEMNYWPAEPANLPECAEPLVRLLEDMTVTGAHTARKMYGARGWVCHHNADLWRAAAPVDGAPWGIWPTGGAWLCKHLFDAYEYSGDMDHLRRVYPVMKGAAEFFVDALVEDATGQWLVTSPSLSPENQHPHGAAVCAGPVMDSQIIRDLFDNCIASARILSCDEQFAAVLRSMRDRLPPNQIGKGGQLQEWMEDWDQQAPEQDHRHISHLYGLFPSRQIDAVRTPALAEASKVTLNARGDLTTGWATAWRINCWARLLDGERAHAILKLLLAPSRTDPNLFNIHPPFQIDGNFGGASGIIEMLLQSHRDEVHLLPALPSAWGSGRFSGLRARGGVEVDARWCDGALMSATLRGRPGAAVRVRCGARAAQGVLGEDGTLRLNGELRSASGS